MRFHFKTSYDHDIRLFPDWWNFSLYAALLAAMGGGVVDDPVPDCRVGGRAPGMRCELLEPGPADGAGSPVAM